MAVERKNEQAGQAGRLLLNRLLTKGTWVIPQEITNLVSSWNSCRDATVNTMVGIQQAGRRKWTAFKSEEEEEGGGRRKEESKNVYVYRIPFAPAMRLYALVYLFSRGRDARNKRGWPNSTKFLQTVHTHTVEKIDNIIERYVRPNSFTLSNEFKLIFLYMKSFNCYLFFIHHSNFILTDFRLIKD